MMTDKVENFILPTPCAYCTCVCKRGDVSVCVAFREAWMSGVSLPACSVHNHSCGCV